MIKTRSPRRPSAKPKLPAVEVRLDAEAEESDLDDALAALVLDRARRIVAERDRTPGA